MFRKTKIHLRTCDGCHVSTFGLGRGVQSKSNCPLKVVLKLMVRVWVGLEDNFCTPTNNQDFDKVGSRIRICLFHIIFFLETMSFSPSKDSCKLLVRVWVGLRDCFCTPTKNCIFDKVRSQISIYLFQKNMNKRC